MRIELYQPLYIHELGGRQNQEDSLWPRNGETSEGLYIVCDGMGGHEKGEVASQTISEALGEWFHTYVTHPFTKEQMVDAMSYAYKELDKKDSGEMGKMGTTLTLLYIDNGGVIAAHIGDSRIYHIRPSEGILYQSRDHSLVFDLYQSGEISYAEMATHPKKNIITRAVIPGEDNRARADIVQITNVEPGDYFYLCSDGMLETMSNEKLFDIISATVSDEEKREHLLLSTANNADNHTAWLLHVKSVTREVGDVKPEIDEEATSKYNAINVKPQIIDDEEEVQAEDTDVTVAEEEIQIEEDGDVEMLSPRQAPVPSVQMATPASAVRAVTQPNNTILKKSLQIIAVVLLVAVVLVAGYIFVTKVFKNHKNKPAIKPQTEIVNRIKRVS